MTREDASRSRPPMRQLANLSLQFGRPLLRLFVGRLGHPWPVPPVVPKPRWNAAIRRTECHRPDPALGMRKNRAETC